MSESVVQSPRLALSRVVARTGPFSYGLVRGPAYQGQASLVPYPAHLLGTFTILTEGSALEPFIYAVF